jgi:hypothetical protein
MDMVSRVEEAAGSVRVPSASRLRQTMSAFDAVGGVATTGLDEIDETRAFNRQLAELVATITPVHVVDDPVKIRADRERGGGPLPVPVRLDEAVDRRSAVGGSRMNGVNRAIAGNEMYQALVYECGEASDR